MRFILTIAVCLLATVARAGCPSTWPLDSAASMPISVDTNDPSNSGQATDADAPPTYRVYEEETATPILTGSLAKLDDANTTGFYTELLSVTTANGFEVGKGYTIVVEATVAAQSYSTSFNFQCVATIDADGSGFTAIPWNAAWGAEVSAAVASDYQFASTHDGFGSLLFRRTDGATNATPYYAIQDKDGDYYNFTTDGRTPVENIASAGWGNYVLALTPLNDSGAAATPHYGSGDNWTSLPAGYYIVYLYASATYNAPIVGREVLYYNGSQQWFAPQDPILADTSVIGIAGAGLTNVPWNAAWAAETRTAVGLAAADLDTQLGAIPTLTELNARTLLAADYFDAATDPVTLAAGSGGDAYGFVGTLSPNNDLAFRRADGATNATPYYSIQDADDGTVYSFAGNAWVDAETLTSATWTNYVAALTSIVDGDTNATPFYGSQDGWPNLATGYFVVTLYDSNSYNAAAVSRHVLYYEASEWREPETPILADTVSMLNRIGAFAGSGDNTVLGFFKALARSDAATPSDLGGTYTPADHSTQAIRVRGDAAWTSGGAGGSGGVPRLKETTVASAPDGKTIVLADGSADADSYPPGTVVYVVPAGDPDNVGVGEVRSYDAATKTITLERDLGVATAGGDTVIICYFGPPQKRGR